MAQLLLVDDDAAVLTTFGAVLRTAGHTVLTAATGAEALELLDAQPIDLAIVDLRLPDMSGLEVLRSLSERRAPVQSVVATGFGSAADAVAAMRLGAFDFLEKPVGGADLVRTVDEALDAGRSQDELSDVSRHNGDQHPPAIGAWARAVVQIVEAGADPRTVDGWSRWIAVSPARIRRWCRSAGLSPRSSLVFGRLLRAVARSDRGFHRPENLLDVVDKRTLQRLMRMVGFDAGSEFPTSVQEFLDRQRLIVHPAALNAVRCALEERMEPSWRAFRA